MRHFQKRGLLDNCKKGGHEAIASFASPKIHHCARLGAPNANDRISDRYNLLNVEKILEVLSN